MFWRSSSDKFEFDPRTTKSAYFLTPSDAGETEPQVAGAFPSFEVN